MQSTNLRRVSAVFLLGVMFVLLCTVAQAQTVQTFSYTFPGVTADVDIAIANLNNQPASATVAFYRAAGDVTSTTISIEPGRQTRLNSVSSGVDDFTGSVVITSALSLAVSASEFQSATPFDFFPPSDAGSTLIIPFAPLDSATIDVNVFNPGTEQAEVKVVMLRQDGTQDSVTSGLVDPKHSTVFRPSAANVSHIMLRTGGLFRGDRPITANAFIQSYRPDASGAVLRTDFAVVPAIPTGQSSLATTIPFFSQGQDYFSSIEVVNLSGAQQTVKLTARKPDGTVIAGSKNPASVDIPAWGSTRQIFSNLFGVAVTELTTGSVLVEGTAPLEAAVAIGYISQPSVAVLTGDARALSTFDYPIRRTGREFFTGLTFLNRNDRDANATMSFVGDDGKTVSTVPITVPRSQQLTGTLAELFPEAQGNGFIYVRSDSPLVSAGLEGRADGSALAARRPIAASSTFNVPAQEKFLVVGGVFDQTSGVANVAIRISGPVEAATLTDSAGQFVFRDLPPGTYALTPIPIGYTISPSVRTATITNANSRNNNFSVGLTPPVLTKISPDGAVVNSDSTTITVEGSNFIGGNVVVFEVTELPTTFISDTKLTATIDRSLLTASGDVAVVVRNRGPSGSAVDSQSLPFTIGNSPPVLTNVTGQPSPLIAGSVTASFTVTITGSGFTPATQIQVNGLGRVTTFISQIQIRATLLPGDVATPGYVLITARNPGAPSSAAFQLSVLYSPPRITAISPATLTAQVALDAQAVRITVEGSGFIQDATDASITSRVLVDNVPVNTEFISSTRLVGIVPASLVSSAGIRAVAVTNPDPTIGPSEALPLYVSNPVPVITSINAGPITYNTSSTETVFLPILINGSNFSADSTAWVSLPCDTNGFRRAQTTTRMSAGQIAATIPIRCSGAYQIQIRTPQPGGGTSNTATLNVGPQ